MLFGEGMDSGCNRGFAPRRVSNQWDIETKASIGFSLSRFAAKSQCCAVLLTLRLSSVKSPSIGNALSPCTNLKLPGCQCSARRTITPISTRRCRLPRCHLSAASGKFQLRGEICSIPSAERSGTSGSSLLTDSRKPLSSSVNSEQVFAVSSRSGYNGTLTQALRNSLIPVSSSRT